MSLTSRFAKRSSRMRASEIRELLKLLDQPDIISFAGGIPDPAMFPREAFEGALGAALSSGGMQYSTSEGYAPLRRWIAGRMASLGVPCDADHVLITSGSQQALDYLGKLFLDPGDTALVGWPTYLGALGAFNAYEPSYGRLDVRANRPSAEIASEAGGPIKFAYATPDFANPTGVTMTRAEREALIDLGDALDCAIIEDAAYEALRYEGEPVPPVLALEIARKGDLDACRTVFCGSFSKTLSPGLRIGWVVAAKPVIAQLVLMKQAADLQSATLNQMAMARVAEDMFDSHVRRLCDHYKARRDAMLDALDEHMPEGVTWTRPEGGMFVWVTLPEGMDGAVLLERAVHEARVAFVPGAAFFADGSNRNTLRLNFSSPSDAQIREGIARLARVIAQAGAR